MVALGLLFIGGGATAALAQNAGSYATALVSLVVNPESVKGGANAYAQLTLNQPVPAGQTFRVELTSSNNAAADPKDVVLFQAGQMTKSALVRTFAVSADETVSITGTDEDGNVAGDSLLVRAVTLHRFTLNSQSVYGGTDLIATVELDEPAPAGGVDVNLSSNNAAAEIAATVHINGGSTSATTPVTTHPVHNDTDVTLQAELSGVTKDRALEVKAPDISSLDVTPNIRVNGGQTNAMGRVSLTGPAPAGYDVTLSSDDGALASVPATLTFGAGSRVETFPITVGNPLNDGTATITAIAGDDQQSDLLHVKGLHISVRFANGSNNTITSAPAGTLVNLRILLSDVADGDKTLTLVSSDDNRILVPPTSKVINGHSQRSIMLTVGPDTGPVTVTVTLDVNGDTAHGSFTVN